MTNTKINFCGVEFKPYRNCIGYFWFLVWNTMNLYLLRSTEGSVQKVLQEYRERETNLRELQNRRAVY